MNWQQLRLNNLSIRQRVLLLALLPMVLITLSLSSYMISTRINHEKNTLLEHSQALANYLATGAEFGLFAENISSLKSLSNGLMREDAISDILFINSEKQVVYQRQAIDISTLELLPHVTAQGPQPQLLNHTPEDDWALQVPVINSVLRIEDFDSRGNHPESSEDTLLGWVVLIVNEDSLQQRQQQILLSGLAITLLGLLLAGWLALRISRGITRPLQAIISTVERLGQEDFNARVTNANGGELGELERGINSLANRVHHTRLRLEDEVHKATSDLQLTLEQLEQQNRQLDSARHRAETANQAKDSFLARMSHELRTPLTSIIGFSELLNKTEKSREQEEYVDVISRTSSILLQLIDDILDFSKLESDAIQLESISFDLERTVEEVLEMQSPLASEKRLQLHLISPPDMPRDIRGDPTRIRQVITNLVTNALKFTERGYVCVVLEAERLEHLVNLRIRVQDTGIGIPKHRHQELFQPFSQADSSITRRFGGSGLGLVICRYLVELMGGEIKLDSTPGQGTEICISLQLPAQTQSVPEQPLAGQNILLLDLASTGSSCLHSALSQWQLQVQHCYHLSGFFKRLQRHPDVSAVLINLGQSPRRGAFLIQLMRRIRRFYNGPVLCCGDSNPLTTCSQTRAAIHSYQPFCWLKMPLTYRKLAQALQHSAPVATPASAAPLQAVAGGADQPLRDLKLLVAEDNRFNRLLLERMLHRAGARVRLVHNGALAVAESQEQYFDCILMDVHMPDMDGIRASHIIARQRAGEDDRQGPIIALTANVVANEARALREAGVVETLFKPISEKPLLEAICRATTGSSPLPPDESPTAVSGQLRLSDYGISESELHQELNYQLESIRQGWMAQNRQHMREHSHQLIGLAGLLNLEHLEATADRFNRTLKTEPWHEVWQQFWRLQRVILKLLQGH